MFKGSSLSFRLYAGFAAVLLIVGLLGTFAYSRLTSIRTAINGITEDNMPGIYLTGRMDAHIRRNNLIAAKHVLAEKGEYEKVEADLAENRQKLTEIFTAYEKTISQPRDRELFDAIAPVRQAYLTQLLESLFPLSRDGKKQEAKALLNGSFNVTYEKYRDAVLALQDYNKTTGDKAGAAIKADVASAVTGIIIGILAALAMGAAVGIFLSRSISSALNKVIATLSSGSEQVASASGQVSQSSQQMAEGASQQASSLEETSASLEEMSSMTQRNSENSRQANSMAVETQGAVERSREAMARMGEAIGKIKGSSDQTAKIIKTIDEIAFQTNLLALNAAVEAARAGDAGKGFAVVAEEVRNLAQRSAEAAKSTASLIEESQQNANNGVEVSAEVGKILSQIVESVGKLSQLIGEVSAASEEQSKGIQQIGIAVTEMDKLTQANAANAEESASASEELAAQAKELGEMVQVLVGIVKGSSAQRAAFSASPAAALPRAAKPTAAMRKPAAAAPRAASPKGDWSPAGKALKARAQVREAKVASANGHAVDPEKVIPMDDLLGIHGMAVGREGHPHG